MRFPILFILLLFVFSSLGCVYRFEYSEVESGMQEAAVRIERYPTSFRSYPKSQYNYQFPASAEVTFSNYENYPKDPFKSVSSGQIYSKGNVRIDQFYFVVYVFLIFLIVLFLILLLRSKKDNKWKLWNDESNFLMINFVFVLVITGIIFTSHVFGKLPLQSRMHEEFHIPRWTGIDKGLHYFAIDDVGFVLQSIGPDGDYDLQDLNRVDLSKGSKDAFDIINVIYDPTNGLKSSGDIFCFSSGLRRK